MSGEATLSVGNGHFVKGEIDALRLLQKMICHGRKPTNLGDLFKAQGVAPMTGGDIELTIDRVGGSQLMLFGSVPAIVVAQAWVLANQDMTNMGQLRAA